MTLLITGGTVVGPTGAARRPTCWSTARRSPRSSRPAAARPTSETIDATGKYVIPGGDRRAHPHGAAVRRHVRHRHVRHRHQGGGVRRHHHDHRLRGAAHRRGGAGRAGRLARQGRRQLPHRLRLPHDPRRRRRRLAQGDGPARRRRGHHQLQAVHGVPGRLLLRRRPDPARDAEGARQRLHDHDARRERHRDRRAGPAGAGARRDRPDPPRPHPAAGAGGRGDQPGDLAGRGGRGLPALHRAPVGAARRWSRSRPPATPAATSSPRPARSTST